MIIDRQKQQQFIKDELKAQTDAFKQKLETSALDLLLEKNEVFVGMFIMVKLYSNSPCLELCQERTLIITALLCQMF